MRSVAKYKLWLARLAVISLLTSTTQTVLAEKPTREDITTFITQCIAADVEADFIAKFGGDFSGLDLSGIQFDGGQPWQFRSSLLGANFQDADLSGASINNSLCNGANFLNADLSDVTFYNGKLKGADLRGANLAGAKIHYANLNDVQAEGVDFSRTSFINADFDGAKLAGCKFSSEEFGPLGCDFPWADLTQADFSGVFLHSADFQDSTLREANFSHANLRNADFTGADLTDANFDNANIYGAIFEDIHGVDEQTLSELRGRASRWRFVATVSFIAFLDSPAFPMLLFLVVWPVMIAFTAKAATQSRSQQDGQIQPHQQRFQFGLRSLLVLMIIVAIFVSVGTLSITGLYSLTLSSAFYLMVGQIVVDRAKSRPLALTGAVMLAACLYPLLNILGFFIAGPFGIFDMGFIALVGLVLPLATIFIGEGIMVWHGVRKRHWPWMAALGFALWIAVMAVAAVWLIGEISGSV